MNYKKLIKEVYPLSQVKKVYGVDIVFIQGVNDRSGDALVKLAEVDEDMSPWEQTYNLLNQYFEGWDEGSD